MPGGKDISQDNKETQPQDGFLLLLPKKEIQTPKGYEPEGCINEQSFLVTEQHFINMGVREEKFFLAISIHPE